jgi:hypothetical protein
MAESGLTSFAMTLRPCRAASTAVVPRPLNGIVDDVAFVGEPPDEVGWKLRLEACAIGDLVDGTRLPLAARPELAS